MHTHLRAARVDASGAPHQPSGQGPPLGSTKPTAPGAVGPRPRSPALTWCILSRNGTPNVPNTSLWKCATVTSISFSVSMSTWSSGISCGPRAETQLSNAVHAHQGRVRF